MKKSRRKIVRLSLQVGGRKQFYKLHIKVWTTNETIDKCDYIQRINNVIKICYKEIEKVSHKLGENISKLYDQQRISIQYTLRNYKSPHKDIKIHVSPYKDKQTKEK